MPSSRKRGGTRMPRSGDDTTLPAMLISPDGRMLQPGDAAQRRGLAAAGGAEQNHDLAGRHGKTDAVDRRPADRKLLAQVGNFERRRHGLNDFLDATIIAR